MNSIKDFSWFLVIAIGIYVVIKFLHIYRKRHGSFESLPIIGSLFKKYDSHSTSQVNSKHVVHINRFITSRISIPVKGRGFIEPLHCGLRNKRDKSVYACHEPLYIFTL